MKFLIALSLSFFGLTTQSAPVNNEPDSLLTIGDLSFFSELERYHFTLIEDNRPDYFGLFSVLSNDITEERIKANKLRQVGLIETIQETGIEDKKPTKQVKVIYNSVHDTFFERYQLKNHFSDIFSSGDYNCVSATALYAITFDQFSIPYVIKEQPSHVYLIAFPDSERIRVEATDPTNGYTSFTDVYKKSFLTELENHKLISESDTRGKSTDELFDKYYFTDQNISLKDLAALQYINDGLYHLDLREYLEAFIQFQKAYYLYPHERAEFLMYTAAATYLSGLDPKSQEYARFIPKFSFFSKYGITSSQLIGEFTNLSDVWLFQKSDTTEFIRIHSEFLPLFSDSTYVNEINYLFNYQLGVFFGNQGKHSLAYEYIGNAFNINPLNTQAQTYYINLLRDKISRETNLKKGCVILETALTSNPSLKDIPNFTDILLYTYLQLAHKAFYENTPSEGLEYLASFEALFSTVNESNLNHHAIGIAYSSSSMYYYRKGYTTKARGQIEKGLRYSPENQILLDRKKYLN